jgi:hypothetical protein
MIYPSSISLDATDRVGERSRRLSHPYEFDESNGAPVACSNAGEGIY